MNPNGSALSREKRLKIAQRLSSSQSPEGITLSRYLEVNGIILGDLQEQPRIGTALVQLTCGVQEAGAEPEDGGTPGLSQDALPQRS